MKWSASALPTFSISRATPWAIDVLAECGFEYDSSIYPVRHDRYGIPDAPRGPFLAVGREREILELPPLTYRIAGSILPVAGGGYFRLVPLRHDAAPACGNHRDPQFPAAEMLYFHPWEFDPHQPRLPLKRLALLANLCGNGPDHGATGCLVEGVPLSPGHRHHSRDSRIGRGVGEVQTVGVFVRSEA